MREARGAKRTQGLCKQVSPRRRWPHRCKKMTCFSLPPRLQVSSVQRLVLLRALVNLPQGEPVAAGGMGTLAGPIVGAVLFIIVQRFLVGHRGDGDLTLGIAAVLLILLLPRGIVGWLSDLREAASRTSPVTPGVLSWPHATGPPCPPQLGSF